MSLGVDFFLTPQGVGAATAHPDTERKGLAMRITIDVPEIALMQRINRTLAKTNGGRLRKLRGAPWGYVFVDPTGATQPADLEQVAKALRVML